MIVREPLASAEPEDKIGVEFSPLVPGREIEVVGLEGLEILEGFPLFFSGEFSLLVGDPGLVAG